MDENKYILVTGGAGYIGSHTVCDLYDKGYTPVIADDFRNSEMRVIEGLKELTTSSILLHQVDVSDKTMMREVFQKYAFAGMIHFAANKSVVESVRDPLKYYRNNLDSLITCLELCKEFDVRNVVFSSSCTVYGEPDSEVVTEETPWKPSSSPYGASKQMSEQVILDLYKSGSPIRVLCLRYFNPIGAHPTALIGELPLGRPDNLLPFLTQTAIGKREKLTVFGNDYPTTDGTCIRDYIHVMDLAEAHTMGLIWLEKQAGPVCEALNIGTGKGTSILEIIHIFETVSNVRLNWEFGDRRPGDVIRIYADVSKAGSLLGWKAKRPIREAVLDAWNWELKQKGEN